MAIERRASRKVDDFLNMVHWICGVKLNERNTTAELGEEATDDVME